MEYSRFLRLRREVWDDFESRLGLARRQPRALRHEDVEALALRYRQVLHDHALASARYPGTGVARRLERLALDGTHWLHLRRDAGGASLLGFFGRSFPAAFRRHGLELAVSVGLFVVAALFGFSVAVVQPGLGFALLGPEAVDGLERGRLWTESLVTTVPPAVSSSSIATNNMAVALTGWAGGALAGLGSVYVVLLNGFLLGAIVGVTTHYSMAAALLEFVSAHGPLEITLILVSGAGGLGMGRALVQGDDRPRREAVGEAARSALVLLGGCLPWFALLAVVEALVSPSPAVASPVKLALGAALEGAFLLMASGLLVAGRA